MYACIYTEFVSINNLQQSTCMNDEPYVRVVQKLIKTVLKV